MMTLPSDQVTQLLVAWSNGDAGARDELMKLESQGHTLQTSALVNEAFFKLVDQKKVEWKNRAHFFGIAAQLMRWILVDYARCRRLASSFV